MALGNNNVHVLLLFLMCLMCIKLLFDGLSMFARLLSSTADPVCFKHISGLVPRLYLESGNKVVGLSQSIQICEGLG